MPTAKPIFEELKKNTLARPDHSKKGSLDEKIKDLCDYINTLKDYYTSSSCAGRIVLIEHKGRKKNESEWIFATHDLADEKKVWQALSNYQGQNIVLFVQQAAIIHIGCRTLEQAQSLVETGVKSGFKRSGIIATKKKIIVELLCTEHLAVPVHDKQLLVTEDYVSYLTALGNKKLEISWKAISRLHESFRKINTFVTK